MNSQVENVLRTIFRRCIHCDPSQTPSCPKCAEGETCSLSSPSCTACPKTKCIKTGTQDAAASLPGSKSKQGGSNAGPIAGGVIGAILFISFVTWLVWRFCIKNRRQVYEDESWGEEEEPPNEKSQEFADRRDDRASTHTVQSIASTVLTRASNIIQIAYIPGVTNRSPPSTPGLLVPPVPPLPFGSSSGSSVSSPAPHQDQHFFMPDLRGSTYSGASDNRSTVVRDSVTPSLDRSSVATTIYRNNAVVEPLPARQIIRGKAAVVSVKTSGPSSPSESRATTPPVPVLDQRKYQQKGRIAEEPSEPDHDHAHPPPSPAFSVGSTFLNSTANTAKAVTARPVNVKKPSKQNLSADDPSTSQHLGAAGAAAGIPRTLSTATHASATSTHSRAHRHERTSSLLDDPSSDEDDRPGARARRSFVDDSESPTTVIDDTPAIRQSPFSDAAAAPPSPDPSTTRNPGTHASGGTAPTGAGEADGNAARSGAPSNGRMETVIEEATRRASRQPTHGGLGGRQRNSGPFSDRNEMKE
ncbi:MAG: hypothetical protein M1837_000153 [Sclerophora amabilis]|nr:MAG: hypothetical protein M1837_000153 [Sclerophora amabilis]